MSKDKRLTFYLPDWLQWQVARDKHGFLAALRAVFVQSGWQMEVRGNGMAERLASVARPGWAMFYKDAPMPGRSLTMRRSYLEPFWHIEKTAKRWEFDVAKAAFDPTAVNGQRAGQFGGFWRTKLELPEAKPGEGFVYVPLQGKLLAHRRFQAMSPIEMVQVLAEREAREIIVTLPPSETYSEAERETVAELCAQPRITLSTAPMTELLARCDYVAAQNSSVVISGFLLDKPAILFGQIDFHHVAGNVPRDGIAAAFAYLDSDAPDYARYLFWFFQERALNVWRPDFPDRLKARLAALGLEL
jgi:hypothetical protein